MAEAPDIRTRQDIEFLLAEWSWLIDHGRARDAVALYTDDAEQSIAGVTARGIDAIARGLERRAEMTGRTSRHVISNLRLSMSSAAAVDATWILTLYRSDDLARSPKPILVGDVQDSLLKEDGCWKIRSRAIVTVFAD